MGRKARWSEQEANGLRESEKRKDNGAGELARWLRALVCAKDSGFESQRPHGGSPRPQAPDTRVA